MTEQGISHLVFLAFVALPFMATIWDGCMKDGKFSPEKASIRLAMMLFSIILILVSIRGALG